MTEITSSPLNNVITIDDERIKNHLDRVVRGAAWLAREIAAALYGEDVEKHWQIFQDYDTPELKGDEWTATPLPVGADA